MDSLHEGWRACRYFGNLDLLIDYSPEAQALFKAISGARPNRGYELYFKEGITYSLVATGGFSARYMPPGFIFDAGGPCVSPSKASLRYVLGFLNSALVRYFLRILNPTINCQPNDISRVPYVPPDAETERNINALVRQAIETRKGILKTDEM